MSDNNVIVGVDPSRSEHADAIALGALLARLSDARLLLVSVYEPRDGRRHHAAAPYEHAVRRATTHLKETLDGLVVERLVLPGESAARVLHHLVDERRARAVVVGSSPRAPWGQVEAGHVFERLLHGGAVPAVIAPRGYAARAGQLRTVAVGYRGTPESEDALRAAEALARASGASLRLISVFEPSDYMQAHALLDAERNADLRPLAEHDLQHAVASVDGAAVTGDLIEADPADVLAPMSADFDLLVLCSRSYSPLRAALLSGVSGVLVRRAACPLMVVPHAPDREHEVTLVGGVEAPRGEES
jgi:nucleotide-binding universal stress UspA family protein